VTIWIKILTLKKTGWSRLNPFYQTKLGRGGFTPIFKKMVKQLQSIVLLKQKRVDPAQPTFV